MQLKRSHGGGNYGDQVVLGAVGLGNFARLRLPDPPDGLELDAAYDHASGRITVSVGVEGFSASAVDLAAALALPPGAVGPAVGVGTDFLSSPEAIAAVSRFVRELLIPGDGEGGGTASEEVAAALRLVEEGKAYEVDWAGLIWAVLKGEVLAGTPRRYAPFLLRLLEYQRPELFAEVDEMLPLRKRWKGRTLQPSHCADEKLGRISEQCEVEDKEEISFDYTLSQDIGDLEEMPIFGEGRQREVTLAAPVDCRGTFLDEEEILGMDQGHAELRSQRCSFSDANLLDSDTECGGGGIAPEDAYNQTFACNSSFGWQLRAMDEQDDSSGPLPLISGTKTQPASNLQRTIEIDDDDDDDLGVGVGSAVVRNVPLEISPYPVQEHGQTLQSFNGCIQQILACVLCMQEGYSDKEKDCRQLQDEVQCLKKMVMKKEHIIEATRCDILKDLRANETKMDQFEKAREVMFRSIQQYKKLVKKSSAAFQEYKNIMQHGKGADSYLGVLGITYGQKQVSMQQLHNYCLWILNSWSSESLKLDEKVKQMAKDITSVEYEVKRLKESISIPDLNNGTGDDGEDQAFPRKSEDTTLADERDIDSSTAQEGKHLGEMTANPAQILNTEGSLDVNRVQVCSADEACHVGASQGST